MPWGNGRGDKVIADLEQARDVLKDCKDATWGGKIAHPEPQIIVACAVVCHEVGEVIDNLADLYRDLDQRVKALEEAAG